MNDRIDHKPTRPPDLAGASTTELLAAWHCHVARLVEARHGLGDRPLSTRRLRLSALDALAVGQALADAMTATRWTTASEALTFGADLDQVAAAMGIDRDEVVIGLTCWADGQLLHGGLTQPGRDELSALVSRAARGGSR